MKVWHLRLEHLNAADIIRLAENPISGVKIKDSKILPFCKTCKLTNSKKKLSKTPMQRSHHQDKFIHIDIESGGQTLEDPDNLTPSFTRAKYFILITDNAIQYC
jgi:hypothetical protein